MNNQILTGIIIIAIAAIVMAIMVAIGTGYIQKGRSELAKDNTKKVTDNQDSIKGKLNSIRADQKNIKSQLEILSADIMTQQEKETLLIDFGTMLSSEFNSRDFQSIIDRESEYIETSDEHKKQRIKLAINSAKYFFDKEKGMSNKKYQKHIVGAIGFDFQDFTVRNSKYDSKIRNKIIGAIGKLFGNSIDGTWRYRSLGDTYILFIPVLNENELIGFAKKIHVVLNSYDWSELDAELFLSTITTYLTIHKAEEIEDKLRCIFKSLLLQKVNGTVFEKAIDKSNSTEELFNLISYKKVKK